MLECGHTRRKPQKGYWVGTGLGPKVFPISIDDMGDRSKGGLIKS